MFGSHGQQFMPIRAPLSMGVGQTQEGIAGRIRPSIAPEQKVHKSTTMIRFEVSVERLQRAPRCRKSAGQSVPMTYWLEYAENGVVSSM
jgi:hypothetical protein